MCTVYHWLSITVGLSLEEARRVGDLNIDLSDIEIIRWRRKVRDALRRYDDAQTDYAGYQSKSGG